jgi:hypothetical protein
LSCVTGVQTCALPISDYMDALQYACLQHDGGGIFGSALQSSAKREIAKVSYVWT